MGELSSVTAESLNAEELKRLAPLIVYLLIIAVTGIPGNLLVCLTNRKSYKQSNSKLFILWLAMIDCIICVILFLEIVNVTHQYTFHNVWLCKLTIFFTLWPTITSGGTLCVISIDRYRKVCKPHGWQISNRMARVMCLITVLLALLFSWPSLIVFGIREITLHPYNITGRECTVSNKFEDTLYVTVYNGFLWLLFVASLSLIAIFYILIGRKIFKQLRKTTTVSVQRKDSELSNFNSISVDLMNDSTSNDAGSLGYQSNRNLSTIQPATNRKMSAISNATKLSAGIHRQARARKSAYIMFLISVAFTASFLPYLILRLNEAIDVNFVSSMSDGERAAYKGFLRCYFLNCAINPFIYCAFATQFRKDVKTFLRQTCRT